MSKLVDATRSGRREGERALATADWASSDEWQTYAMRKGSFFVGSAPDQNSTSLGYEDDRHVLLVAGSRSGKGASTIVPNLIGWPGSAFVLDPKGENAVVAASRRSRGSSHCKGIGQETFVLDPFNVSKVSQSLRATYNPLDDVHPRNPSAIDDAARIAASLVVAGESDDPYFDDQAKSLIKALILHVTSSPAYQGRRNLVSIRHLILEGYSATRQLLIDDGDDSPPTSFELLFADMKNNEAYYGMVSRSGANFLAMVQGSQKTFLSVLSTASNHTEFIDSPGIANSIAKTSRNFSLSQLKTHKSGISVFVCLPQRYMSTHARWLRLLTDLVLIEMERIDSPPATGHPLLMMLDEFAALQKMEFVEHAAAQIAGFGVKMCFVVQQLSQLKTIYKDNWEIFISNSGTKIFFGIEDKFTRTYLSDYLGETEITRITTSVGISSGRNTSTGRTQSQSTTQSNSSTSGMNSSTNYSTGGSVSSDIGFFWDTARTSTKNYGSSSSSGHSTSTTSGSSSGSSYGFSETIGQSTGTNSNESETLHKRALLTPDEIGRVLSRVDDKQHPAYPGLAVALFAGSKPLLVRRENYYDSQKFRNTFDPHPNHGKQSPLRALKTSNQQAVAKPKISLEEQIYKQFGQENISEAIRIRNRLRSDYPGLKSLSGSETDFVHRLLMNAKSIRDDASQDGRSHSMAETITLISEQLPSILDVPNSPLTIPFVRVSYGDEHLGNVAKRRADKAKRDAEQRAEEQRLQAAEKEEARKRRINYIAIAVSLGSFISTLLVFGNPVGALVVGCIAGGWIVHKFR